jgi:hypothetical protein
MAYESRSLEKLSDHDATIKGIDDQQPVFSIHQRMQSKAHSTSLAILCDHYRALGIKSNVTCICRQKQKLLQQPFVVLQDRGHLFLSTKTTAARHQSYTRDDRLRSNLPLGYLSRNLASVNQKQPLPVSLIHAIDASSTIGDKENDKRRELIELENSYSAPLF